MALRQPLIIATRQSQLALWQANHMRSLLEQRGHAVRILGLTTRGDQILEHTLSKVGGKALFVKEQEIALQEGCADLSVHSLKDMPMQLPDGLTLACVLERCFAARPKSALPPSMGMPPTCPACTANCITWHSARRKNACRTVSNWKAC